jgi:BirA family transcriptional regulator, biotin operon repressor / biotin---[acetyl-CoA-carboxylase] ligase
MIHVIKIQCSDKQKLDFICDLLLKSQQPLIFEEYYFFDTLSSTQDFANTLRTNVETNYPVVILSESQTGGRGRRGSNWASPSGGVWMSMMFESELETGELFPFLILAAFIISEAVESQVGVTPQIKWPNDLLIEGKKFAGILMDTDVETGKVTKVTIGVGINSNNDLEVTSNQILDKSTTKPRITTLRSAIDGQQINNFEMVAFILFKFSNLVPKLNSKLFRDELRHLFKRKIEDSASTLSYRFKTKNNEFAGEIVVVNDDGSILVRNLDDPLSNNLVRIDSVFDTTMG